MRRVKLVRSGLAVSRLGFGTSRLHYLSAREADALVGAALDLGATHLDTAPLYGDGFAEAALGRALGGRRSAVTIGTKFGRLPSRLIGQAGPLATPLRGARSVLRRLGIVGQQPARSWSAATVDASLSASLRRMRTDYVDILFFHEPEPHEPGLGDEAMEALLRHKAAGRVRAIGVAAGTPAVEALLARYGEAIDVLQIPERDWSEDRVVPDISFGAVATGPQVYGAAKPARAGVLAAMRAALDRRPAGCVLAGTTKAAHLRELADLVSGPAA